MQKRIRIVVILGTISLIGLIISQIYWLQKAFDIKEKELDQSIHVALINVAHDMAVFSKISAPNPNPVIQLSANYFVVNINDKIDANVLEHYLIQEFQKNNISLDFEYGIYDCENDNRVYGDSISLDENTNTETIGINLPKYEEYIYYFGLRFPSKTNYVLGNYKNWIFSSLILIIVILFFSATLFIILKQKQLSEVQKDFINNMTHEFKTPISTIKVSTEVLSNPDILENPDRLKKYIDIIKSENFRLQQQVDTVLRMADIEKHTSDLQLEEIDIHGLINEIGSQLELRLEKKGGSISYQLEARNYRKLADQLHLKNVISNLLDNAFKYSKEEVDITIRTSDLKDKLIIEFIDKGIGIAAEEQKRIFNKFYRVPKGNVHNVKGFGLGLNYVLNVIKHHRWKIEVESSLGKGSNFKVII